jgi:hypothetical protein
VAGNGGDEAGGPAGRAGELKVGRSSEASRLPHPEQNRPAAGTSVPHFRQRTTIASGIESEATSLSRFDPPSVKSAPRTG